MKISPGVNEAVRKTLARARCSRNAFIISKGLGPGISNLLPKILNISLTEYKELGVNDVMELELCGFTQRKESYKTSSEYQETLHSKNEKRRLAH